MFTGLVEELGMVTSIIKGPESAKLTIAASIVLEDVKMGDSIAVNGVCLTVVAFENSWFQADVMAETLEKSALGDLKVGHRVNLERAMRLGDRLGGHMVSGHIDGIGILINKEVKDIAVVTEIQAPAQVLKYVIKKGSIAVDGISLTVVDVKSDRFIVSLIPHTAKITTIGYKKIGDKVNLESDLIGKYIEKLIQVQNDQPKKTQSDISLDFLSKHGFA